MQGGYNLCVNCPNGNGDEDPKFVSPTDLRLLPCSPGIDMGDNSVNSLSQDINGNPRVFNATGIPTATIDIGAYEMPTDNTLPSIWTGLGDGLLWTDQMNWDDEFLPQFCRDIIIPMDTVTVPPGYHGIGSSLSIQLGAELLLEPTAKIDIIDD